MVGSLRLLRIAAFRSNGVNDSINLEFSKGPTFSGLRLGMSSISLETTATAESWLLAMSTSMFITLSMLFKYPAGTV